MLRFHFLLAFALCTAAFSAHSQVAAVAHKLSYAPGKSITLSLPQPFDINIAASGLRRVRFFAQAPDGRIFATGMYNRADNTNGSVFILEGWNAQTHTFAHIAHYLDHLRNPNNLAFYTEPATPGHLAQTWLYLPLTDRLLRFKYTAGDEKPSAAPEVLARFPDYGLNYKYGGWHLTRTVAVAALHGHTRVYIAAGSSCDYCREHEVLRASLLAMDLDGTHQQILAHGLRNAVDLRFIPGLDGGALFATNMGDDHLGDHAPEDTFFELDSNDHPGPIAAVQPRQISTVNYGWPTCFFTKGKPTLDSTPLPETPGPDDPRAVADRPMPAPKIAPAGTLLSAGGGHSAAADPNAALGSVPPPLSTCEHVPPAYTTFTAHASPLGMAFFGAANPILRNTFLIALHGSGHPRIAAGYRVVRLDPQMRTQQDFLTGFLTVNTGKAIVNGRPCGLLQLAPDTFLLTDDLLGLVYFIHPKA